MSLRSKRLSLTRARLEIFIQTKANLRAQFLELMELRERVRKAELLADLKKATRARRRAPVAIAAAF
jgi:hypothetical protein